MTNPLLSFEYRIPFDQIKPEHVEPAIHALLEASRRDVESIASSEEERTYENTMGRLDSFGKQLEYAINIVRHLESVATTPELRAAYNVVQPQVSAFFASLPLNEGLWNAIRTYASTADAAALRGARARYLKKTVDDFRRHGA